MEHYFSQDQKNTSPPSVSLPPSELKDELDNEEVSSMPEYNFYPAHPFGGGEDVVKSDTGIDTLKLLFPLQLKRRPDFHILQRAQLRGRDIGEGYLWRDPEGQLAYGALAYRRVGNMRFRIAPVGCEIRVRAFFSVSNLIYGNNAHTIARDDLRIALQTMQDTLEQLGVVVDWREGLVSRLDVHRDVALPRPFHHYLAALRLIEPPYGRLYANYPTGVVRGAATKLVYNLYDKRAQCEEKKVPLPTAAQDVPSWLRCEARLPTAAAVRAALGVNNAGELVKCFERDACSSWLSECIGKKLLNAEVPDYMGYPVMDAPTLTPNDESWWRTQLTGNSPDFINCLCKIALDLANEKLGPQKFWELAKQTNTDGALPISKLKNKFRQTALCSFSDEGLPIAQLYQELQQSLLLRSDRED